MNSSRRAVNTARQEQILPFAYIWAVLGHTPIVVMSKICERGLNLGQAFYDRPSMGAFLYDREQVPKKPWCFVQEPIVSPSNNVVWGAEHPLGQYQCLEGFGATLVGFQDSALSLRVQSREFQQNRLAHDRKQSLQAGGACCPH